MKRLLLLLVTLSLLSFGGWSSDQLAPPAAGAPAMLKDVGIDARPGESLPLDLVFRDETGKDVRLGEYFHQRPVILTLVYYKCPMLCTLVLNELTRTMNVMSESAGKDFDVVTVSFDPKETAELATAKKTEYLRTYRRPTAAAGWHFLTGDETQIRALTQAVGFRYTFDTKTQQYVHASGVVVVTPDGKLGRYFYGVQYAANDLRLALIDARSGKSSSPVGKVLYYCFQYDPTTGKYSLAVMRLVQFGFVCTVACLTIFTIVSIRRSGRRLTSPRGTGFQHVRLSQHGLQTHATERGSP
ncbi:MAG TPA: SCO family protein [Tepidisphaeraceae bacterium]|jgi:protein SCO1/2